VITGPIGRRAIHGRDVVFVTTAILVALALGRILPAGLDALSARRIVLVPFALAFLLLVSWLSFVRPTAAIVLAFALLGAVRVEPAPVDAAFAILIVATFVTGEVHPRVPGFLAIPVAGFAVVSILSMTNAVDMHRAVKFEATTIYMLLLAVWLSWVFTNETWTHLAIKVYILVAAVSGIVGTAALYLPLPARHIFLFDPSRAQGLFKDPNVYSAFMVPAAAIALEELTSPRFLGWRRRWVAGAFAASAIGVVVAFSRAAWLNLFIAVTVLILVQAFRRRGIRVAMRSVFVLLACGVVGFLLLLQTGSIAFLQERSHLQHYDSTRFSNQSSAFSDVTRHALGYGPGQADVRLPLSTHSAFARTAFEQGLLGILLFIVILAGTLLCAIVLARRQDDVNGIGTAALLGIWLGQCANSFFIDSLHWRHIWIFAALIWSGYSVGASRDTLQPGHQLRFRLAPR
jgi:hypothetical protein